MLRFKNNLKGFDQLSASGLAENEILERYNLQEAIVNSWDAFRREIGMPELFLIGKEISPHDSIRDSIDILAYDADENAPVVIELKRDKHKLQLLQAISYAAMIASWDNEKLITEARHKNAPQLDDLGDALEETTLKKSVRIILIAEKYDPEVIIASDWLYEQFGVDVMAFGINTFKHDKTLYLTFNQRYPLSELQDTYELRTKNRQNKIASKSITWSEVADQLNYPWGKKGIELCLLLKEGDPSRRRFLNIRTNLDGFIWITLNFRRDYINVYIKGEPKDAIALLRSKFKDKIEISKWRDGYSLFVDSESKFKDLVKWLKLEKVPARSKGNSETA